MAIIVFDGFDHYSAQQDLQSRIGALNWSDLSGTVSFGTGRGGYGRCVQLASVAGGCQLGGSYNQNLGAGISAAAIMVTSGSDDQTVLDLQVMDYTSGAAQLTFRILTASGTVLVYLGDPTSYGYTAAPINSSPPNAANVNVWLKYEVKAVIGTSGSYDLHVNGNSVISGSGVLTQSTSNAFFNGLRIRSIPLSGTFGCNIAVDDFNLTDLTTGPGTYPCNNFVGDCAVRTLYTASNVSVSWTPLANANWQEVGESQFDGDTSYNYTTTNGNTDKFTFGSLPTDVSAVFAVQITGAYRKQDASAQTIQQAVYSGVSSTAGANWTMSLAYTYVTDLCVLCPATSATWTVAQVNALNASYTLN